MGTGKLQGSMSGFISVNQCTGEVSGLFEVKVSMDGLVRINHDHFGFLSFALITIPYGFLRNV
jgi:hypothetical protein